MVKAYLTLSMRQNGSVLSWMSGCLSTGTEPSAVVLVLRHPIPMLIGIAEWRKKNPGIDIPVYGVPINTREALGVLHFKGFIIDDSVLYSGASLNDVYLHQHDKYRYDRYQLIRNAQMADIMFDWVTQKPDERSRR